jgi:superfamily II DNA or RNA helicase
MAAPEQRTWVYDVAIGLNDERHRFIASLIQPEVPTAVVVNRIEHGLSLSRTIPGAVFLDGSCSENERIAVLEDFRLGKTRVVVVTKILDRGTNRLGNAEDLIFASGEGSATQTLQRIGRGLRRANGKEFLRLVDIVDHIVASKADRRAQMAAGFLQAAARRRLEVYATEGFEVQVKG